MEEIMEEKDLLETKLSVFKGIDVSGFGFRRYGYWVSGVLGYQGMGIGFRITPTYSKKVFKK